MSIEHQNIRKGYIKYTYSKSKLDGPFKTLILSPEVPKLKASRCTLYRYPASPGEKWGTCPGLFFQKRLLETQRHLYQNKAKLKLGLIKKISSKSVHSTTSYCKVKVPCQMTKKTVPRSTPAAESKIGICTC